jgi:acetylornithine deacetylase/succinyl-diaminopimelate desuccinylase-like protein
MMYDEDYRPRSYVEFTYVGYDPVTGSRSAEITRRVEGESAEYLPPLLEAFMYFLQGMTFTYVDNVVAVKSSGGEVAATEA